MDHNRRITVRNLRIREDTAKYLLNLDINSAHYDAKSRAMRADPLQGTSKQATYVRFHRNATQRNATCQGGEQVSRPRLALQELVCR